MKRDTLLFVLFLGIVFFPLSARADYSNLLFDAIEQPSTYALQTLETGLSGTLTHIDILASNPAASFYGSRVFATLFQCPEALPLGTTPLSAGCSIVYSGLSDTVLKLSTTTEDFSVPNITLDPSQYYILMLQGNNQNNTLPIYYGSATDTIGGQCFEFRQSLNTLIPCADVSDLYINLIGVSKSTSPAYSNVLFVPGVEASRLYETSLSNPSQEVSRWEPVGDADVTALALDEYGKSLNSQIFTRDVVDKAYGLSAIPIYSSFLDMLNTMKYTDHSIADYSAAPYDWRLSLDDILAGGVTTGSGATARISYTTPIASSTNPGADPYILSELRRLAASSHTGKVTIVAHSNGGLVVKALLKRLQDTHDPLLSAVDKVVFVAVPQLGTPEAVGALLHGTKQGIPDLVVLPNFALSEHVAREFVHNAPVAYNLLPSSLYFTYVDTPVVSIDQTSLPDWTSRYGTTIHSQFALQNFLTDTYVRVSATSTNITQPTSLSLSLLSQAQAVHDMLDSWVPPASIQLTEVAGWGVPNTIKSLNYKKVTRCNQLNTTCFNTFVEPTFTVDGDGTVVTPSALWSNGASVNKYWVNLKIYNKSTDSNRRHKDILEVPGLLTLIKNTIITPTTTSTYQYISNTQPIASSTDVRLVFALHSPLTLNLYDSLGRHTGISTTTGALEEQIPGTYYRSVGEVKYIFSDSTTTNTVIMNGYATGTFTFNVNQYSGSNDDVVASTTFKDIPTSTSTVATLSTSGALVTALSPLVVDSGDSHPLVLTPKLNDVVTVQDITPPVTTATTTGTTGLHGWYTSSVDVGFSARDADSGVASTTYSLNGGLTWLSYEASSASTSPIHITAEGTTTLLYYSVDTVGNKEATSTLVIKIDTGVPEARVLFDPRTQTLGVVGLDALSSTTLASSSSATTTTYTVTDDAGHTLKLMFNQTKPKIKDGRIALALASLVYDGKASSTPTTLKYKWSTNKKGFYDVFASYIHTKTLDSESHYRPKKDVTILMTTPTDLDDTDRDDDCDARATRTKLSGMVVVGLKTNKGSVVVDY